MPYGQTGVDNGAKGTAFAKALPWAIGQISGTDSKGNALSKDVQFLIDSGAAAEPLVDAPTLTGFQVVFQGVRAAGGPGGAAALTMYTGATIQAATTQFPILDLKYNGVFLLTTVDKAPPILGTVFWQTTGGALKIDIKGGAVTIS